LLPETHKGDGFPKHVPTLFRSQAFAGFDLPGQLEYCGLMTRAVRRRKPLAKVCGAHNPGVVGTLR
jgi:hypothetical protein